MYRLCLLWEMTVSSKSLPVCTQKFCIMDIDFHFPIVYDKIAKFGYRSGIYRRYTFNN